jgi:hypothetical protein
MATERPNERLARYVVSTALGVRVERFEDGTSNGQIDALIHLPGGPAALEIVADHEQAFNEQWAALHATEHRLNVPGLQRVWSAQLARRAKVKTVLEELPALLLKLESDRLANRPAARHDRLPLEIQRLGVRLLYPLDDDTRSGYVNLHAEGWGGWAGSEDVSEYVERILAVEADVPSKLAAHPAQQKHAFIWTTIGTSYAIQSRLEPRDQPMPTSAPRLPDGVTHVWVAGSFTSQGALAWFPDRGWWKPDWKWPDDGPLVLPDA